MSDSAPKPERDNQPGAILKDSAKAIEMSKMRDTGRFGEDGLDLGTAVKIIEILREELVIALEDRDAVL